MSICPCEPNKPCAQGHGAVITDAQHEVCTGQTSTPEQRMDFINRLTSGTLAAEQRGEMGGPSFLERAKNFGVAVVKHVADGLVEVSQDDYLARLATCDKCPHRTPDWKCNNCGCYLTIKAKWRSERCPLAMWPGDAPEAPLPPKKACCGG